MHLGRTWGRDNLSEGGNPGGLNENCRNPSWPKSVAKGLNKTGEGV